MSFELKQIITQIIAFLIMLWVLKRYMWKPLMELMDERTHKIQATFKEIEEKNRQADLRKAEYEKKISAIKDEGQVIIQNAVKEARTIAQNLEVSAQQKAHEILNRAQEQAKIDLAKAKIELKKEIVDLSFHALEKLVRITLTPEDRERFALDLMHEVKE